MKRVVLLGGGHAHVHVLRALAAVPLAGAEVCMVTPFRRQMYSGMVPGLIAGHYSADACAIPLPPLAQAAKVKFIDGAAAGLDADRRLLTLADGRRIDYDVLSVDTGATMPRDLIPGAREHGLFVRPIEHFVKLFDGVLTLAEKRPLDIVVIGGGAAGFELALALAHRLGRAGVVGRAEVDGDGDGKPDASRIALVLGGAALLPGYPQAVVERALRVLKQHRITLLPALCSAIDGRHVHLDNGARLACDVPLIAVGTGAPGWLAGSGLQLDAAGFVNTAATLQSLSHPNVFAAGDVASRPDAPHARSGVYAVRAGPPLAENLRRFCGAGELLTHDPGPRTLNLLSCGGRRAIMSWGRWSAEGRWVWWWKDHIDRKFVRRYTLPADEP